MDIRAAIEKVEAMAKKGHEPVAVDVYSYDWEPSVYYFPETGETREFPLIPAPRTFIASRPADFAELAKRHAAKVVYVNAGGAVAYLDETNLRECVAFDAGKTLVAKQIDQMFLAGKATFGHAGMVHFLETAGGDPATLDQLRDIEVVKTTEGKSRIKTAESLVGGSDRKTVGGPGGSPIPRNIACTFWPFRCVEATGESINLIFNVSFDLDNGVFRLSVDEYDYGRYEEKLAAIISEAIGDIGVPKFFGSVTQPGN